MRVSTKALNKYPFFLKPFFWSQKRRYGEVLVPGLLWARVPKLFSAVAILYGVLDRKKSPIDPVLKPGQSATSTEIAQWCRDHLAPQKVPRYVLFVDDLPHTATHKVAKAVLRDDPTLKERATDLEKP